MQFTTCGKCPARIFFAETRNGRRNPIDADPAPRGNIKITERGDAMPYAETLSPIEALAVQSTPGAVLYMSHFVTCPKADTFRRKGS